MKRKIKTSVTHQGIGGCEFIVDEQISKTLTNDEVWDKAWGGNFACMNFVERRPDFNHKFPHKLYYGKVDGLGYIVSEDEFEDKIEEN